jgi:hypothetical protein
VRKAPPTAPALHEDVGAEAGHPDAEGGRLALLLELVFCVVRME